MRRISWAVIILVILTSGYSALWFAAHSKIQSSIHIWKSAEQDVGRVWTCGKESLGGFPLQIVLTCEEPTFENFGARRVRVAADFLQLETHVFSPTKINFLFRQKVSFGFRHQAANLSFERLNGFMKWGRSAAWEIQITGQNFRLSSELDGLQEWTGSTLGSIALRVSSPGMDNASPRTLNVAADIEDARPTARNVLTVNGGALDGNIFAQLTHWDQAQGSPYAQLGRWRMDGRLLTIVEAGVSSNGSGVGLSGSFRLDELHRIDGKGNVKFSDGLILTNMLKSLSGGNFNLGLDNLKPPIAGGPRLVQAPITLTNGKVYVGPIDTRLRTYPLY